VPSEPPDTSPTCLDEVLDALGTALPALGRTVLVAVDGPAGSGKSTLATGLAERLATPTGPRAVRSVAVVHMDDLYDGWTGLDTALEGRVLDQLLKPLAAGRPARWQRYDWHAGRFGDWHTVEPPDVLVLEGCGSGAARYAPYTSLLVWLEVPPRTRIARGIERDGEQVRNHWMRWMRLEAGYFAANRTAARADVSCRTV
jgi:uridine kinase